MEPMEMELNVPIALAIVIGMISFLSWTLAKNFEEMFHANRTMAGDGLVGIEQIPSSEVDISEVDISTEEEQGQEEQEQKDGCDGECELCECPPSTPPPPPTIERILTDEVLDDADDSEVETEVDPIVKRFAQITTDIDSLHENLENLGHKVETTHNLVTQMSESMIGMNDSTQETLSNKITTLQNTFTKEFSRMTDTQERLSELVHESKLSIGMLLAKPPPLTESALMTYATLDSVNFMKKMMTDEFRTSLTDYATLRSITDLKVQMEDLAKRMAVQKTVYQAWNGSAKWSDFNEGELNIQMVRKKFATAEQNDEWLLPENKTIAAYNRDQLLGLNEDNWATSDNMVFTKRYYKDDWDASVEVAITVTLSKKILVPPGAKPEVTISHILRKLSEKEQIQWEHLLVNA